jgi:uncharacterized protein (DUF58 family)
VLLASGVVLGRPLLFGGAAAVFGWLFVRFVRFVHVTRRVRDTATIEQRPATTRPAVDAPTSVDVSVALPSPVDADLTVDVETTMAARQTATGPAVTVAAGDREGTGKTSLVWDVAGQYHLNAPIVTLRDPRGLFVATLPVGERTAVTVNPPRVGRVALGRTWRELVEDAKQKSKLDIQSGIEPEGIREHVTGDSVRHIDWKATARLNRLHVREFDMERGRSVGLVIDARQSMTDGPVGRTKLDYVRHLALSVQEVTRLQQFPVGLFVCDEAGTVVRMPATMRSDTIRRRIHTLHPEPVGGRSENSGGSGRYGVGHVRFDCSPVTASRTTRALDGDASAFATRLRPFFARGDRPARRGVVSHDSLYKLVTSFRSRQSGPTVTYLFTDDTHRATLPEAIRAATRGGGEAIVFLTPSVLFDTDVLANPQVAYDRFIEFERFRRSLATYPRVSVYEVGPGEELAAVLTKVGGRRARATQSDESRTKSPAEATTTVSAVSPGGER